MKALRALLTLMIGFCSVSSIAATSPSPLGLLRAVHANKALWLLYEGRDLRFLIDTAEETAKDESAPSEPVDICRHGESLVLAAKDSNGISFYRKTDKAWRQLGRATEEAGEKILGLACQGPKPILLTQTRLVYSDGATVRLLGELPKGFRYTLFRDDSGLLVGSNAGEWGGGLARISLPSGRVNTIEDSGSPVHDIAAAPGKPGCTVIAIGLVHFFPSGRLTEVCGLKAQRLFAAPFERADIVNRPVKANEDPYPGIAFYGLARNGSTLTAISIDGLRTIDRTGVGPVRPLPKFVEKGGVQIGEVSPGLLLVLTGVNARASIGGAMPLAVER